jgi:hypothetical protein
MSFVRLRLSASCIAALAVSFALAGVSFGAEYFVLPSGNDAHAGSAAAPFKTISRGLFELKPGDTLTIGPGAYRESCELSVKGTESLPVLIRGAGDPAPSVEAAGEDAFVIRDSTYVTVEGLKFANARRAGVRIAASDRIAVNGCDVADNAKYGVYVTLSDHITIAKCRIHGTKEDSAVYVSATDHPTVTDCTIEDNAASAVYLTGNAAEGGDGLITGATVARNIIRNNGEKGGDTIHLEGIEKSSVDHNMCDNNLSGGIVAMKGQAARAGSRNTFSINVVRFPKGRGLFGIRLASGSTNSRLEQNTIVIDSGPAIDVDAASAKGFKSDFNFFPAIDSPASFSWKGQTLEFAAWQRETGQDAQSHQAAAVPSPGAPPGAPAAPAPPESAK